MMAVRARTATRSSIQKVSAWPSSSPLPLPPSLSPLPLPPPSPSYPLQFRRDVLNHAASFRFVHESLGPDSVYDLYAVVVHTGAVLAGHYFSFMRPEV